MSKPKVAAKPLSQRELKARLAALGPVDEETRNRVTCALIGHSMIVSSFFGYQSCGRCGQQIGDTLGGTGAGDVVVIGHNCKTCRKNYKALDWRDKLYVPNPFKEDKL